MREIKFRFFSPDGRMLDDHSGWIENIGINEAIKYSSEYGYKIMQFTGLKDKNGKNIYEGDIISRCVFDFSDIEVTKWIVYFGTWCYMRRPLDNENGFAFDVVDARTNCTVIGNIFESNELLNP